METETINLGIYHLITKEREQLGIRLVGDYEIWLDEHTILPGYEGYGHFIIERGYGLLVDDGVNFQVVSDPGKVAYSKPEKREEIFKSGYEFISTMKLAALSIGSAAVYGKKAFSDLTDLFPPPCTEIFWLHLIQSWMFLGMASDRLRSFFIQFVRCESEKEVNEKLKNKLYKIKKKLGKSPKQYVYVKGFCKKNLFDRNSESRQYLKQLYGLLNSIANIRLKRNRFVHDYCGREAMVIAAQRNPQLDHADVFSALKGDKSSNDYISELADAYNILVQAGNLVFLLERDVVQCNYIKGMA